VSGLDDVSDIVVSPDGLSLYIVAAQGGSLVVFSRDPDSGALTFQAMYQDGDGIDGLDGAYAIAVAGDGKNIYVGTENDDGVATFAREVHDPPVFVEYGEPVLITPWAKLTDVQLDKLNNGDGDWSGATIWIGRKHGGHGENSIAAKQDSYGFVDGNGLCFVTGEDGSGIIYKETGEGQSAIGTYTIKNGRVTIEFSAENGDGAAVPTSADVNNVLRQVTYENLSQDPPESVTIAYYVSDGNSRWHGEQGSGGPGREVGTIKVDIKSVNDAPVIEDEERIVTLQEDECYTFSGEDFPYSDAESHELKCVIISELPDPVTGM